MKLSRRHFLTRAAGISAAALIVTLPVTAEYNASGRGRVRRQCPCGEYHDEALPYDWKQGPEYLKWSKGSYHVMSETEVEAAGLPWTWS
jgi:hypothetical protein